MVASPHLYREPTVLIGTQEVECHISMVTLIPEVEWVDVETYCNPNGEAPGAISWRGTLRVRMSYGTDSAWELFSTIGATEVEMTILPGDTTTASEANPEATFDAWMGVLPFIPEHDIGASATFDLEYRVIGEPVFAEA